MRGAAIARGSAMDRGSAIDRGSAVDRGLLLTGGLLSKTSSPFGELLFVIALVVNIIVI